MMKLDHVIVASPTLPQGIEWAHDTLGVRPAAGGQHLNMGTHNALLRLQSGIYLEIIAIDPSLPAPLRPRWFGLDTAALTTPTLWHVVLATSAIEQGCQRAGQGVAIPMQRKHFDWLISVPENGELPSPQGSPTLIQWQCPEHPAQGLPDVGLSLNSIIICSPHRELTDLYANIATVRVEQANTFSMHAVFDTPLGRVSL